MEFLFLLMGIFLCTIAVKIFFLRKNTAIFVWLNAFLASILFQIIYISFNDPFWMFVFVFSLPVALIFSFITCMFILFLTENK